MMLARLLHTITKGLLVGGALCFTLSSPAASQVQSTQKAEHGPATQEVKIERGEIVYVSGNDMIVRMEDGSLDAFNDVPDSRTVHVDGKELNIHQLKPGMTIEKQTVTSTTLRLVTTVETVTGKVWQITPPTSVMLTLENGENQRFKIPKGQKFTINGKETDAFGLKKGMVVSAQRVTEVPETVVATEIKHKGKMPPPPPTPKADVPVLVAVAPPAPAVETASAEPAPKLPKTASELPLFGLVGALLCAISLTVTAIRKVIG
jgi:RNase P/RNase MRP subunit p29